MDVPNGAVLNALPDSEEEDVPSTVASGEALAEKLSSVMTRQGFQEGTLAGPFEDYLGQGLGKAPLVLIYESQFVEAKRDSKLRDTSMLLYPQPGLVLKHVLVARTDARGAVAGAQPGRCAAAAWP